MVKMRLDEEGWFQFRRNLTEAMQVRFPQAKRDMLKAVGEKAQSLVLERYTSFVPNGAVKPAEYQGEFGEGLRITYAAGEQRSYLVISDVADDARFANEGRGPGEKPPFEDIADWAESTLGLDPYDTQPGKRKSKDGTIHDVAGPGARAVQALRNRIAQSGTAMKHNIFHNALAHGTRGGVFLQAEIELQMGIMAEKVFGRGRGR